MYATGPAVAATVLDPGDWGIRRAVRRLFADPAQLSHNDAHNGRFREYMGDLLAPYDLTLGPFEGRGQSYGEMAEAVIRQAVPPGEEVDLLVLCYAIPDIAPGRATAAYLSHVCPGKPLAFAISDQGTAAAFTGLRLVREYARTGGCERALLVIVEQAHLPYETPAATVIPQAHAAVALLFGAGPVAGVGAVRNQPGAPAELSVRSDTAIVGRPLAGQVSNVGNVLLAPPGQPFTGVWWELAGWLDGQRGPVLIADYDPQLRYLSTAEISVR